MGHLAGIPTDSSLQPSGAIDGAGNKPTGPSKQLREHFANVALKAKEKQVGEQFMTSVYASRYASQDLPKYDMPESGMPKEIAYRMIKDETSLDGNPIL